MPDRATITVDINVLLDVFQRRPLHYAASAQVLNPIVLGTVLGVCPAHGLTTLCYLVRKAASKADAEAALDAVLRSFQIGNLDSAGWQAARGLPLTDFEDAAVAAVAVTVSVFIVTRNVGDFVASPVPAITPVGFLGQLALCP